MGDSLSYLDNLLVEIDSQKFPGIDTADLSVYGLYLFT